MKKAILIKMAVLVYQELIYPIALKYVKSTKNDYDDKALKFLDDLVKDVLKKI